MMSLFIPVWCSYVLIFISFELSFFDSLNSQGRSQENFGWVGGYLLGGLVVWNNPQMMGTPKFFSKFYLLMLIFMKERAAVLVLVSLNIIF